MTPGLFSHTVHPVYNSVLTEIFLVFEQFKVIFTDTILKRGNFRCGCMYEYLYYPLT